ncbi:hypothetical protein IHV10_02980 [Fictibacillus sp. 5RED26]|uniref:hypothetical protein n=1 Tax=unclassified Fictibacillus TaxID=2644029 RepID=UPI0018CE25FF|nr:MULTISPECIES: hypothetical protein [unclassified Fictibacillus]MBH0155313.1 hypothetical protein [Fictibacillus sp. 5RED26]MBH0164901.1 hypothetical protein [Fictibacillus sp. 7GRE50]MBH0172502.1 hypothetical protein [Fictibacillus sp. 23RED33]
MNKTLLSLIFGAIIGSVLSYFLLDYENQTMELLNYYGEESKIVHELDFNYISNTAAFIIVASLTVFLTISLIERKNNR